MSIGHLVDSLVTSGGYPAVFGLVGAESLGIPLPGETALVLASIYAGTTHRLSPWPIFAAAAAGAVIGDNIGFWIGTKGGYRLALRYGPKVRLDQRKLKVARYLFDRQGAKLVFFGRFVSVLRTYAAFLAGTNKMRWPRFLVANAAGGIGWAAIYTAAGYLFGGVLERLSLTIDLAVGGIAALAIVLGVVMLRRRMADLTDRAEKAYPGPLE
jgi:membrane protein DedA with SNARE-associated domain